MYIENYDEYYKTRDRLQHLNVKTEEAKQLEKKLTKLHRKLNLQSKGSLMKRALALLIIPFKTDAFARLGETIMFCLSTIILAPLTFSILLAMLFCGIVDALCLLLYGVLFPVTLLFCMVSKPIRVAFLKKRIHAAETKYARIPLAKIRQEIAELTRAGEDFQRRVRIELMGSQTPSSPTPPTGGTDLPPYATDPTLDMHPGDY